MMSPLNLSRRHLLALSAGVLAGSWAQGSGAAKPLWQDAPSFDLGGALRVFWGVADGTGEHNRALALNHGFSPIHVVSPFNDYEGGQRENISRFVGERNSNPWRKPPFFERIVKRNIATWPERPVYVLDFEIGHDPDVQRAWRNPLAREQSGTDDFAEFSRRYHAEWSSWFALPLRWLKQRFPQSEVGLYDIQPYIRYQRDLNRDEALSSSPLSPFIAGLWPHLDALVDFVVAGLYQTYDEPGSLYYAARNIEGTMRQQQAMMQPKPVYAFEWLRFHQGNRLLSGRELPAHLTEGLAALPFFYGARGTVLWGWEPDFKRVGAMPYETLPLYLKTLARLAPFASAVAAAQAEPGEGIQALWRERRPLLRALRLGLDEWLVMALDPWRRDDERSVVHFATAAMQRVMNLQGRSLSLSHIKDGVMRSL